MQNNYDVTIIGGGLAGLTSAIHLSKAGLSVALIEQHEYPRHKVCGEYISNEVLPYLISLGLDPSDYGATKINRFQLSATSGKLIETQLPLGGFGLSRYEMDHQLLLLAKLNGTQLIMDKVNSVTMIHDEMITTTNSDLLVISKLVIGAFGKRSNIDTFLHRPFIKNDSPFLAVKAHYSGTFPDDLVSIHNFKGGYCGVSKVENDHINICYIANYNSFKQFKNLETFQEQVLCQNSHLKSIFDQSKPLFKKPLTISQISFSKKQLVENHILMCGDSAGMIHPLCGNGMSMAIHSAKILCESILNYFNKPNASRMELEQNYSSFWNQAFNKRLKTGRTLSKLFELDYISEFMLLGLKAFPSMLPTIIKKTHGNPIEI